MFERDHLHNLVGMLTKLVLSLLVLVKCASSARILALMTVASHSHHLWNSKYLEALAARGHHITYFSVDKYKNNPANITQIVVRDMYEIFFAGLDLTSSDYEGGPFKSTLLLEQWDSRETEVIVKSDAMRQLNELIRKQKFDLVVQDFGSSVFLLGAVDVLGRPPVVGITAYGVPLSTLEILGNPMAYSSKPYFYTEYSDDMTLFQRAHNYFLHLFSFAVRWFYMRNHNENAKKYFGEGIRPLDEILDDINIIMVNANYALDYVFPKVPGLIPIGGLHIQEPKPLPQNSHTASQPREYKIILTHGDLETVRPEVITKPGVFFFQDLKTFLDEAKDGVIYFSLGSNVKSSLLKKEKVDILVEAFKKLSPVQVLWKWETDFLPNKPENVKIEKWLPQTDVLAHPNVRMFFTHSGMLSTQEAIYHGKPIVGMPFFLDQHVNVKKCVKRGLGGVLDFKTLTVEKIVTTIRKVLTEPKYTKNAEKASFIFRDHMESPLDRAVYWTEYAIRHKGAPHLRHSARNLSWYQNWMLDVILLTSVVVFLPLFWVCKFLRYRNSETSKQKMH